MSLSLFNKREYKLMFFFIKYYKGGKNNGEVMYM
jgi:hypothetical protein